MIKDTVFKTRSGRQFFGQMLAAPKEADATSSTFIRPRRILKVGPRCEPITGEVIRTAEGTFLVLDHTTANRFRLHKLVQLDRAVTVSRTVTVTDVLTGMAKKSLDSVVGTIDCAFEFIGQVEDMQVPVDTFRVITDFDLHINDKLDGRYLVRNVEVMLGARVATVR